MVICQASCFLNDGDLLDPLVYLFLLSSFVNSSGIKGVSFHVD